MIAAVILAACGDNTSTSASSTGEASTTSTTSSGATDATSSGEGTGSGGTTAVTDPTGVTDATGSTTAGCAEPCDGVCCTDTQVCVDNVLIFCLERCDPLAPKCAADYEVCAPYMNDFICTPPEFVPPAGVGEPCQLANTCGLGLTCLLSTNLQNCSMDPNQGCCTPICDLSNPAPCPGDQEICEAWFAEPAPAGYENVGACALPQP